MHVCDAYISSRKTVSNIHIINIIAENMDKSLECWNLRKKYHCISLSGASCNSIWFYVHLVNMKMNAVIRFHHLFQNRDHTLVIYHPCYCTVLVIGLGIMSKNTKATLLHDWHHMLLYNMNFRMTLRIELLSGWLLMPITVKWLGFLMGCQ